MDFRTITRQSFSKLGKTLKNDYFGKIDQHYINKQPKTITKMDQRIEETFFNFLSQCVEGGGGGDQKASKSCQRSLCMVPFLSVVMVSMDFGSLT